MGIPSYYRKLTTKIKGLLSSSLSQKPSSLFFDFNCLIYYVARRPQSKLPPYPGHQQRESWESLLVDEVLRYVMHVWREVGEPKEVFLSVDGVVPMAKIRQQRMRRFKSIWLAEQEKHLGLRENKESWDTNCITPGTAFMRKLNGKLTELCQKPGWSVSGSDEPGEGEHKIMRKLRSREATKEPIVIYGLDADLILLTLLNSKSPAYLVREDSELALAGVQGSMDEHYSYFSLEALKTTLPCSVIDYVAGMSLMGNDFLPHSLTIKLKDDGYNLFFSTMQQLQKPLVAQDSTGRWIIQEDTLFSIIQLWASMEEERMFHAMKKKVQLSKSVEKTLENIPMEWCVEQEMFKRDESWTFVSDWKHLYRRQWNHCSSPADVRQLCAEYMFGLQWVLDYYTGQRNVEMNWCYTRHLSPLWCDLAFFIKQGNQAQYNFPSLSPIQPSEQLAMVLPQESWHLLEDPQLRLLPSKLPQYWPKIFGFFSVGRHRLWECEPMIPMLNVERIRQILSAKI